MGIKWQINSGNRYGLECFQVVVSYSDTRVESPVFLSPELARTWAKRYIQVLEATR